MSDFMHEAEVETWNDESNRSTSESAEVSRLICTVQSDRIVPAEDCRSRLNDFKVVGRRQLRSCTESCGANADSTSNMDEKSLSPS